MSRFWLAWSWQSRCFALCKEHLVGEWRWIYVITVVASLYLNVFVLVVQTFVKVLALIALAPTQTEPPFVITQAVVLAIFILIALIAVTKFRDHGALARENRGA
jgi:hypothetical protein